jgi:antitoxin FitA
VRATGAYLGAKIGCMRTSQLREVSSTRVNVVDMSKMIQVRNVPDEMHRMLKMQAAAEGISLSDLIKRELGVMSGRLSFEELSARVRARGPSKVKTKNTVRYIREARGD